MAKKANQQPAPKTAQKINNVKVAEPVPELKKSSPAVFKYALFLGILAFCLYANTLKNGYVLDDPAVITENTLVTQGFSAIPQLFSTPYHYGNHMSKETGPAVDDLYRPLSLVMFAIEYQLFPDNPVAGHFVNIVLYAGCVMVLFMFLHHLFRKKRPLLAFVATLLFAVHPIHTEVVANIKSRDELLCFFFGILSLYTFLKYLDTNKMKFLLTGLIFYFLSLFAKESSITLLAVIPLIFFFYRNENRKKSIFISLFALAPAVIYLVIRFSVLIAHNAYNPSQVPFIENALVAAPSFSARIATAILVMGYYIKLLIVPYPLICDYTYNTIPYANFGNIGVLLALAVYCFLIYYGISRVLKKRGDPLVLGILFFLITTSIFSNILFLIGSEMAERFMFFPSAGFCVAAAFITEQLLFRSAVADITVVKNKKLLYVLIPVCLVFTGMTVARSNEWKDGQTLFGADSKKAPDNGRLAFFLAHQQLLIANAEGTDPATKQQMQQAGIANLQKSVAISSGYRVAHVTLALAFIDIGQMDSAEAHTKAALALLYDDPGSLSTLANLYIAKHKYAEAIAPGERAFVLDPSNPNYAGTVGVCDLFTKQYDSAVYYLRRSVDLDPANKRSVEFIAKAYDVTGRKDSAQKYESLAKRFDPGFSVNNIGLPQ